MRTGIVPFTSVSTHDVETAKSPDDKNFQETVKRNELAATGKALEAIAKELVAFLEKAGVKP